MVAAAFRWNRRTLTGRVRLAPLCFSLVAACTSPSDDEGGATEGSESSEGETGDDRLPDYGVQGPWSVGHRRFVVADTADTDPRDLPLEVWYPSEATVDAPSALVDFAVPESFRSEFAPLVEATPAACAPRSTLAQLDLPMASAPTQGWPLVVFSHCHSCTRFSSLSVAERLASHGFVVVAPDHVGNTLEDELAGQSASVGGEFLTVRANDVVRVLDALEAGSVDADDEVLAALDFARVGMFGHSFGAATTGRVLQDDPRVRSGAAIAAPVQSPLLPGVALEAIEEPMLFLVAREDNSITEIGNNLIRSNYAELGAAAWLIEVEDAGHWSFSNICGVIDAFAPGCGDGERQTAPGESFTYVDNATARDVAAGSVASFFAHTLRGEQDARSQLETPHPSGVASVEAHE